MTDKQKKVLIIGAKGMLGFDLAKVFDVYSPYLYDRDQLDITDKDAVFDVFEQIEPDIVINAAAYTDVEGAEDNKDTAMLINGEAVGNLAEAACARGAVLVHYSTDYVFAGDKEEGYSEDDRPTREPLNVYGASKLLGEQLLQEGMKNFYLIRTSWLYGQNGKNFVETIIRISENPEIKIKNDEHGKPTYTKDLAQATRILVEEQLPFGIYHLVNENPTTWYDFAKKIVELWGQKQNWAKGDYPKVIPITSADYPTKAERPKYSSLNNTKFVQLRPWPEALEEYLNSRS
ncbi:MAG: dTDP-4-dehydrorhamnose reductase [Candidatus Spechtbacteria bacterium RIFCSPLOWO2_01_FULL_43_12]|uniref:dTDP-4-dehydrorhamnose reductase n=1 Tax=Candidatus Spechtbacteria bacterium RIFCSPLOWO2_01_FULL_43_12 TaxID=1802162 RepID=A0A1G2HDV9_9BACT|nr:MAG: dTDP-4-dehydrorhamnose reductase [Candidatus Spechtbacteria bacterium RIFCSPLOWO2_01_FULL_43_12]